MNVRLTRVRGMAGLIGALCALSGAPGGAWAQPEAPSRRAEPGAQPPSRDRAIATPASVKQQIRSRLDELDAARKRLESLQQRLDQGADAADIRAELDRSGGRGGSRMMRPERFDMRRADVEGEGGPRSGPDSRPEISPEERQRLLGFLDENAPRVAQRLRDADRANPELVTRLLARMRPRLRDVMESGKGDPAGTELRLAEFRTSMDVMWARRAMEEAKGSADAGKQSAAKDELRKAVGEHFDAFLALQEHEADRLTARMEKLRKDIAERREGRDRLIDREIEGLGHEPPGAPRPLPPPDGRQPKDPPGGND